MILVLAKEVPLTQLLLWIGVVIAILIAGSFAVLWYRARILGKDMVGAQVGLLDELRAMRDRGEISPEEFDAAKHAMVSRVSGRPSPKEPQGSGASERIAAPGFDLTGQPLPPKAPPEV